jgi:hypothetical protein
MNKFRYLLYFLKSNHVTPGPTQPASPYDCDFEQGLCSWNNAQDEEFDWTWKQGSTGSQKTGPAIDHTTGTGIVNCKIFATIKFS